MSVVRFGRRGRRVAVASLVAVSLLSGGQAAYAKVRAPMQLMVSPSADRSDAVPLRGATVSEGVAIFTPKFLSTASISFYLDDARKTGTATHVDTTFPFDLVGSSSDGNAMLLDTTKLAVGTHVLKVVRTGSNGGRQVATARFKVVREGVAPGTGSTTTTATPSGGATSTTVAGGSGTSFPIVPIIMDDPSSGDQAGDEPKAPVTTVPGATTSTVKPSTSTTAKPSGSTKIALGAAIEPGQLDDAAFVDALKKYKFDSLTPENAMKFGPIEPQRGQFNWAGADKIVNFAQANGMRVRGHTLNWYIEIPGWVNGLSNEEAKAALKNHIQTVVGRYKGKIAQWDVVNEAFNDDGTLRNDAWKQKVGDDYIALCFQWAHEADPAAKLFYNDYGMESFDTANGAKSAKAQAVLDLVKDFKKRGIPIDGVGFQTHSSGEYPGTGPAIKDMMTKLGALGVKVEVTELDVKEHGDEAGKAQRYAAVGTACAQAGNCTGVTTWGLYDGHTWLPGSDPLMLDKNYKAKPSYTALTKAIGRG
jgi:endo-1,4-beta-xylanase